MVMTLNEVFSKVGKLIPVYNKLAAVQFKVECGNYIKVSGVSRGQSFYFETELKDVELNDFTVAIAPDELAPALKLNVKAIKYVNGALKVTGAFGTGDNTHTIEVTCNAVIEALATDVAKIDTKTLEYIAELEEGSEICKASDVLKAWQSLAKCGKRIFITETLHYATSPSANAFFRKDAVCKNIPDIPEPLQAESTFVAELTVLQQVFNIEAFNIYTMLNGTVFIALSADRRIFAVEGAPVRIEKNTLERITTRYNDVAEFSTLNLPQSAVRDILQTAADKADVQIHANGEYLTFSSGAFGKIRVDTSDFDCACEVAREHTTVALGALPSDADMTFGYGESEGRNFISFNAMEVTIIVPVQDITEV